MSNIVISPDMNLPVPVVGTDPGPDWANNINACLSIIDSHTHTTGQGVPITPDAININTNLPLNNNNLITARSVRFNPQSAPLALAADLGCIYESGVDLYYNDGSGNQIRITQGGSVTGATGTITGLPSGTASASYAAGTFTFEQATNTPATLNVGSVIIGQEVPSGKNVTIGLSGAQAVNYNLTLPLSLPASGSSLISDTSGNLSFLNNTAQLYTPTFNVNMVISSSHFFWYYLAPNLINIQGTLVAGVGSTGATGVTIGLPNSFTIDNVTDYPQGGGTPFGSSSFFQSGNFYAGIISYTGSPPLNEFIIYSNYNASSVGGFQIRQLLCGDLSSGNTIWVNAIVKVM